MKDSLSRKVFVYGNTIFLTLLSLTMLLPFFHIFAASLSDSSAVTSGKVVFWPVQFTLDNYLYVFQDFSIWRSFGVSIFVTVAGTLFSLILTASLAYPLSRQEFMYKKVCLLFILFTIIFSAPLIPTYLLVKNLGLLDSVWALIIPSAMSAFNFFVMRSFFQQLPGELIDAARIDGCGEFRILLQIVVPLSKPAFATIGIFYAVYYWNSYFNALMYINNRMLYPLQVKLREMIVSGDMSLEMGSDLAEMMTAISPEGIKMATIIVATVPILIVYPFLQKYFVKGALLGSVKE
ncbi:carbohydrate ABC transporter permease [Ammoniphilus sp. YIM 78166]|uniref:carbohydrate ABC transporter permease n=1 Tax=Ammoniphilus sp. YIM 78166 TaxID=1644106 RepID=UPI00106F7031|nr:carbohydrate ABC transporter permease [Ammoniphilus sp. YIM 78166]